MTVVTLIQIVLSADLSCNINAKYEHCLFMLKIFCKAHAFRTKANNLLHIDNTLLNSRMYTLKCLKEIKSMNYFSLGLMRYLPL